LNPTTINAGGSAQLCWQVENANTVSISEGIGTVPASGCRTVNPTRTTTYVLTATNATGTTTASATLTISVQILSFTNDPSFSPISGGPVKLSWTTQGADYVIITGLGASGGRLPANGSITVNPDTNSDYTLTAFGPTGQAAVAVLHVFVR
jgi:hypothetical protein